MEEPQTKGNANALVVSDEEWSKSIREIIQRDYFPLSKASSATQDQIGKTDDSGAPRLEEYVSKHIPDHQYAFSQKMATSALQHHAKFGYKKSNFLRALEDPSGSLALKDKVPGASNDDGNAVNASSEDKQKMIIPPNTRLQTNASRAGAPGRRPPMLRPSDRKRDDMDVLSATSRSTTRSLSYARTPLSDKAVQLVEQMRKRQKQSKNT